MIAAARIPIGHLLALGVLLADGGTLQLRKQAGPFIVTVFSTPVPVRVGAADLSVMVQKAADQGAVLDADVRLHLKKSSNGNIVEIVAPAKRSQASNKLLYAGRMTIPSAGTWQMDVEVTAAGSTASASGQLNVLQPQSPSAAYWPYFAFVPLIVLLFAANQWLKSKRRFRRSRALP
ncbi:MAG: hypothetical protein WB992_00850 [Bryobacteraceae bacterium]